MTRLELVLDGLQRFYGPLVPPPRDPFALLVWQVLSAQSTPVRRDAAFAALKRSRALTPDAWARAPKARLESSVALAGPYCERRLRALHAAADLFRRSPQLTELVRGPLAPARRALERFPPLGTGGTRIMLLFAGDHVVGAVDEGVYRVGVRLGFAPPQDNLRRSWRGVRTALSRDLQADVAAYRRAFTYLSHHAATTCAESDPRCRICPVAGGCPEGTRRHQRREAMTVSSDRRLSGGAP